MYSDFRKSILHAFAEAKDAYQFQHQEIAYSFKGPEGEPLFTDIFYTPAKTKKTLIHLSGVHGAEGYLGSTVQKHIFAELADGKTLPFQLVVVHAVNPHGMAWMQRTNKENVDLNRNSHDGIVNPHYEKFIPLLKCQTKFQAAIQFLKLIPTVVRLGPSGSAEAVATGQTISPSTLFFAGTEQQIELRNLMQALEKIVPHGQEVTVIDVHTGLGNIGDESLYLDGTDDDRESIYFSKHFQKSVGPVSGVSYKAQGSISLLFRKRWLTNYVTEEFGTRPFFKVIWTLMNGDREQRLDCFFPHEKSWLNTCLETGLLRFRQLRDSLS